MQVLRNFRDKQMHSRKSCLWPRWIPHVLVASCTARSARQEHDFSLLVKLHPIVTLRSSDKRRLALAYVSADGPFQDPAIRPTLGPIVRSGSIDGWVSTDVDEVKLGVCGRCSPTIRPIRERLSFYHGTFHSQFGNFRLRNLLQICSCRLVSKS